ncbi:MAG: pentapeptide repeat-containing protein [Cyclobacteriaceae bacterium]
MNYPIKKWTDEEIERIISDLKRDKLDVDKIDGLYDLRGISFTSGRTIEKDFKGHKYNTQENNREFKKTKFHNIDFSSVNIENTYFTNCEFINVLFNQTKAQNTKFWNCKFEDVQFIKSNFKSSVLGSNIGKKSGEFNRVKFIQCDLRGTSYSFPYFLDVEFLECKLKGVDFDGSRFENVKFKGLLDSVGFRGHGLNILSNSLFSKVNPHKFPNPMKNVDFVQAKLVGVDFSDGIDLSSCSFPKGDGYLLVENINRTYPRSIELVNKKFNGESKKWALGLLNDMLWNDSKRDQYYDFIDKAMLLEHYDQTFVDSLFALINEAKG